MDDLFGAAPRRQLEVVLEDALDEDGGEHRFAGPRSHDEESSTARPDSSEEQAPFLTVRG